MKQAKQGFLIFFATWMIVGQVIAGPEQVEELIDPLEQPFCRSSFTQCPQHEELGRKFARLCNHTYLEYKNKLRPTERAPIMIYFIPEEQMHTAQTTGRPAAAVYNVAKHALEMNCAYFDRKPEDLGVIYHEMAHFFSHGSTWPWWLAEGVADYIRHGYEGVVSKCTEQETYQSGYRCTAAFIKFLEVTYNPMLPELIFQAIRTKQDVLATIQKAVPYNLDSLWLQYKKPRL